MAEDGRGIERLLRLERVMTDAYDNALGKVHDRRIVETLGSLRHHHQECSQTLQQLAQRSEGSAQQLDDGFRRYLEEVMDTVGDAVRQDEVIGDLRIAEASLGMTYGQVLENVMDAQAMQTIKTCMTSEKEHVGVLSMAYRTAKT